MWISLALAQQAPETLVTSSLVVAVPQQEAAAEAVVERAESLGGWFQARTPTHVSLRVPVEKGPELLAYAESLGKVVDKGLSRSDLHVELADLRGRLQARRSLLDEYYRVLKGAGPDSVVAVERQISDAVYEIELLEGRIRMLEDQAAYARVEVDFQFRDRDAPARDGRSSFRWLNTLNVQDVVGSLQAERAWHRTRGVDVPAPPDGFSAWRRESRYRAASADDVLFVVRTERHKPRAELSFWREAATERMTAAGYTVVSVGDVTADGVPGATLELAAPLGTEDWTYLVAFFPVGRRMVIAEAAGEIATFQEREEAIRAAVGRLQL